MTGRNGILKAREGIFTGVLPKEKLITNNVIEFGGVLLANDLRTLRISARVMEIDRNHISGAGWHLILNDGWQAVTGEDGQLCR